MTEVEAAGLIAEHSGRVCVRFYQRGDGTVVTRDCPGGQRSRRRWLVGGLGVLAALAAGYVGVLMSFAESPRLRGTLGWRVRQLTSGIQADPVRRFVDWIDPPIIMGEVCWPPPGGQGGPGPAPDNGPPE
jgi:hypothetical protein